MEADVQRHFELIREEQKTLREEQSKDHTEVLRRLERVEENQNKFLQQVAVKSEVDKLETRMADSEDEITELEKDVSRFKGQIAAFKVAGAILTGVAAIVQMIIIWWFSRG